MDLNKEKCKALKKIRKKLADTLNIDLHQRECTYEGKCSGTCPKCKQEEELLNRAILTKSALAAGTVAVAVGLTGCTQMAQPLEGDVEVVNPSSTVQELEGEEEAPEWKEDVMTEEQTEEKEQGSTEEVEGKVDTAEPVTGEVLEE